MKFSRLRLLKLVGCAVVYWLSIGGAMGAEGMRFLLLIDHSPDMATRQLATVQTIYNLVGTGFQNQIQPGEQFALWFYGSRLQTNAPFAWQPGREIMAAQRAASLFGGRIYSRLRPREQTLGDAAAIIAASPKLTILIFTEGSQPLSGTPYDETINRTMQEKRELFRRADKPLIISLMTKKGQLIGGSIHTNVNVAFRIPDLEHPPELLDKALAAVRTAGANPAATKTAATDIDKARDALRDALAGKPKATNEAPTMQFAPTLKEIPKETAEVKKDEIKKEEPKEEKPIVAVAEAPKVIEPPKIIEEPKAQEQKIEPQSKVESVTPKAVEVAVAPPAKEPEPKPVVVAPQPEPKKDLVKEEPKPVVHEPVKVVAQETPKPTPPPQPQSPKLAEAVKAASVAAETKPVAPKGEPTAPAEPIQTAVVTPQKNGFPWLALFGGLSAIAALGAIALMNVKRRAKSAGSIITQALPPMEIRPRDK